MKALEGFFAAAAIVSAMLAGVAIGGGLPVLALPMLGLAFIAVLELRDLADDRGREAVRRATRDRRDRWAA